jgi:hypothetical protein
MKLKTVGLVAGFIVLLIIVALAAYGAGLSSAPKPQTTLTEYRTVTLTPETQTITKTVTQEKQITETVTVTVTQTLTREETTQQTVSGAETSVKDGRLELTLHSLSFEEIIDIWKPKEGMKYLVLEVSIKNIGKREESISALFFQLSDEKGIRYSVSLASASLPTPLSGAKLLPGETARGKICFEVPKTITEATLIYDDFISTLRLPLKLT